MTSPRDTVTRALPLRLVDYAEADLVVTLLTEDHGKKVLFAPGGRKSRRRYWGALQPLRLISARYREGSGDRMGYLVEARVLESFDSLVTDLHKLYWASLAMEVMLHLVREDGEAADLFITAIRYLTWLDEECRGAWFVEAGSLRFCLLLLGHEGLLPSFDCCARTGKPLHQMDHPVFSPSIGVMESSMTRPDDRTSPVGAETLEFMSTLVEGRFPSSHELPTLREARGLVLDVLESLLERNLNSLKLLKTQWL